MDDMRCAEVDFLTMGQYLQPTPKHAKVIDFVTPQAFDAYGAIARAKGFLQVASSPLTRSSYHAGDDFAQMRAAREAQAGASSAALMPGIRETRALPYSAEQMFDLVADVGALSANSCRGWSRRGCARDSETEMVADMLVGFKALREKFTSRVIKQRPARDRGASTSTGRCAISTTSGSSAPLRRRRLRDRLLRRFHLPQRDVRGACRASISTARSARWSPRSRRAPTRFTAAAARARTASPDGARRRGSTPSNMPHLRPRARSLPRTARANTTVPTGFCSVPPSGPAIPLIATATSASLRSQRALRHRPDAGDRDRAERVDDVARTRRASRCLASFE